MEIQASAKFVRISPKKVRSLLVPLRGMKVGDVLIHLKYHRSKAAKLVYKLVHSALSNAKNNYNFKEDNLRIQHLTVDSGPTYKRYWLRSRGGADKLLKRSSHLKITLAEINPTLVKKVVAKPVATKLEPSADKESSLKTADTSDKSKTSLSPETPRPAKGGFRKIFTRRTTNK